MDIEEKFRDVVAEALIKKNITKRDLMRMTGISYQTIGNIFLCRPSSTATMNKVLEALDLSINFNPLLKL